VKSVILKYSKMKKTLLIAFIFICLTTNAQIKKITLQASGLTCSMCSNAINKALKTLDFVEAIEPNIKTSSFIITVKENSIANFDKVKSKVEDAGFFVAKMNATILFINTEISNDSHFVMNNNAFHFLNVNQQKLNGLQEIKLLDKGFVTKKDFKKNTNLTKMECYKTGVAASCCIKDGIVLGQRIYHITI
jgi:copper chaperone CopZ